MSIADKDLFFIITKLIIMKTKISILLFLAFLITGFTANAAKKKAFTGKITFKISIDSENLPEQVKAMMPKTMNMYIGENKTKTELFTQMGMQSSIENLVDKSKVSLIEVMGQKYAIRDSWEDLQKEMKGMPELDLERTGETKEIMGYTCEKIVARKVEDGEQYATAWVTSEMKVPENINFSNEAFKDVDDMLLEFQMDTGNGMMLTFTAIEIDKKKIKDEVFEVPEGFRETTRDELQKTLGG
jgi:hypothetical protein